MSARAWLALVLVLGVGLGAFAFPATAAAACDPANIKGGTHYIDSKADGCDKHHVLSQQALERNGIPMRCWPVVNMDPGEHAKTPNWGSRDTAGAERDRETLNIRAKGVAQAFEEAAARFLQSMAGSPNLARYQAAIDQARAAMLECLNNRPPPDDGSGAAVGATVANPSQAAAGESVGASASGVGAQRAGEEFDLRIADAAQLARDPDCQDSPAILSPRAAVVDALGRLSAGGTLGTMWWESGGEQDDQILAPGAAQLCFTQRENPLIHTPATELQISPNPMYQLDAAGADDTSVLDETTPNLTWDGSVWSINPVGGTRSSMITGDLHVNVTDNQGSVLYQKTSPVRGVAAGPSFSAPAPPQGGTVTATAETTVNGKVVGSSTQQVNASGSGGPSASPGYQIAPSSTCRLDLRVVAPRSASFGLTLRMDYGDGKSESRAISPGSGTVSFYFSHVLQGPADGQRYVQRATVLETGRYAQTVTYHGWYMLDAPRG